MHTFLDLKICEVFAIYWEIVVVRYTALVAQRFIFPDDDYFPCENCNGEFVVASDKLSAPEVGDGCDNVRWRHEKMKSMLQKMEVGNSFLWLLFNYTALLQFNICLDKFED